MTTDRQKGRIIICCDTCGKTEQSASDLGVSNQAFDDLWRELKTDGWVAMRPVRPGGEWQHACERCKED